MAANKSWSIVKGVSMTMLKCRACLRVLDDSQMTHKRALADQNVKHLVVCLVPEETI